MKRLCCFILFFVFAIQLKSNHIVGGELMYDKLPGDNYRVTLKMYRDCFGNGSLFDGAPAYPLAWLTVYNKTNLLGRFDMGSAIITNVPSSINNPCIKPPSNICVEQGIYTYTLNLPPKAGGYFLIYQRCCRNNTILNLVTPGEQGSTYYTYIPGPEEAVVNSSPRFKNFPPIFICNNEDFTFDHSAIDPDGDELEYSLCDSYKGLYLDCASLSATVGGCPMYAPPPGYSSVAYKSPYSGAYPISSNPAFSINPVTGQLSGRPNLIGQYVVNVCVQEKRNGKVINTHYRDFQFNVTPCIVQLVSAMAEQERKCMGNTISFQSTSKSNLGYLHVKWDFGVPLTDTDTSSLYDPVFSYPDTGVYNVTLIANPDSACTDTVIRQVYIYPDLNTSFSLTPATQCIKNNSFDFKAQGPHHSTAIFDWQFGGNANPPSSANKNEAGVTYLQPGIYYPKLVVRQFRCVDSCIDTIHIVSRPAALINNSPVAQCDPAKIDFSNGSTSEMIPSYHWLFSDGTSSQKENPTHTFSPAGIYGATLVVTTNSICLDTSRYAVNTITVNPNPVAGFDASPREVSIFEPEITLTNKASDDVIQWQYAFGDGNESGAASTSHTYFKPGEYMLTQVVSNPFNCRDTAWLDIKILPEFRFWIPNSFTPNFDGLNDVFMPKAVGVSDYEFTIFTKWGQAIFHTTDFKQGWDGTFKGKACEQDVYTWRAVFINDVSHQKEQHFGHVSLLPGEK